MAELSTAFVAPYGGRFPIFRSAPAFVGHGAAVLGRATIGKGAWLGAGSVIRADGHDIDIGDDFHLGVGATVHIAHDIYPTHIGNDVTAGEGAVIHACTVGDDCVIGAGTVVLDATVIGPGAVLAAGSVVFPRSTLEGGWLYSGSPAKPVARVTPTELASWQRKARTGLGASASAPSLAPKPGLTCFVAPSASISGTVIVGDEVGIWYGCRLDAGTHAIHVGSGSNIQDNSVLCCEGGDIFIGEDVTIGHNVTLSDCRVAPRSLVGIGARIAPGTEVESDVLVAAGAETEPGQRLGAGKVWGGRPARAIAEMTETRREMMAATLPTYRTYAAAFRATPHDELSQIKEE
jgi:carbonic anhydrase/acetyltransferase-like protein (isoleucine patch superfamily)